MGLVLIACEESQTVCKAFRELGHEAFSCDIIKCSGGKPEWHIQGDCLDYLHCGWDLAIFHPPCTYLTVSGARWLYNKNGSINQKRLANQNKAIAFFRKLLFCDIPRICIENPVGVISTKVKKPTQIVQPWMFGDKANKKTCLWLKNLPRLKATEVVTSGEFVKAGTTRMSNFMALPWSKARNQAERRAMRSVTFKGLAEAMASQWGKVLDEEKT